LSAFFASSFNRFSFSFCDLTLSSNLLLSSLSRCFFSSRNRFSAFSTSFFDSNTDGDEDDKAAAPPPDDDDVSPLTDTEDGVGGIGSTGPALDATTPFDSLGSAVDGLAIPSPTEVAELELAGTTVDSDLGFRVRKFRVAVKALFVPEAPDEDEAPVRSIDAFEPRRFGEDCDDGAARPVETVDAEPSSLGGAGIVLPTL
jgi:hypothetical protein